MLPAGLVAQDLSGKINIHAAEQSPVCSVIYLYHLGSWGTCVSSVYKPNSTLMLGYLMLSSWASPGLPLTGICVLSITVLSDMFNKLIDRPCIQNKRVMVLGADQIIDSHSRCLMKRIN